MALTFSSAVPPGMASTDHRDTERYFVRMDIPKHLIQVVKFGTTNAAVGNANNEYTHHTSTTDLEPGHLKLPYWTAQGDYPRPTDQIKLSQGNFERRHPSRHPRVFRYLVRSIFQGLRPVPKSLGPVHWTGTFRKGIP